MRRTGESPPSALFPPYSRFSFQQVHETDQDRDAVPDPLAYASSRRLDLDRGRLVWLHRCRSLRDATVQEGRDHQPQGWGRRSVRGARRRASFVGHEDGLFGPLVCSSELLWITPRTCEICQRECGYHAATSTGTDARSSSTTAGTTSSSHSRGRPCPLRRPRRSRWMSRSSLTMVCLTLVSQE